MKVKDSSSQFSIRSYLCLVLLEALSLLPLSGCSGVSAIQPSLPSFNPIFDQSKEPVWEFDYSKGLLAKQNDRELICDQNHPLDCLRIGDNLVKSNSLQEALTYYVKACDYGVAWGCLEVGELCKKGQNIKCSQDAYIAAHLKACKLAAPSCTYTGHIYRTNNLYKEAIEFYKKACEASGGAGCFYLGNMYFLGQGVESSPEEAGKYYERACELRDFRGCQALDLLKNKKE